MRSRLAASLTLVTLWLLGEWRLLDRAYDWDLAYFSDGPVSLHFFGAVILSTVVLTVVTTVIWQGIGAILRRYLPQWAETVAALGLLTVTFVAIWHGGARAAPFSPFDGAWAVPVLAVITLIATFAAGLVRLAGVVRRALVAGSVAFPVFVAFTVWGAATGPSAAAWPEHEVRPLVAPSQVVARLVWIIFDEWDTAISGERRPAGFDLPAIDRLRAEAFVATHVQAPGAWTIDAPLAIVAWHFRNPLPVPRVRRHASEAMPEDEELRWIEAKHPLMLHAVHKAVLRDVSSHEVDVVFAHYPIPHLPGVDPYRSGQTSAWDAATYVANLREMDRAVGEIRSSMERAGLWDVTTILISSDHPLRPEHWAFYPRHAPDIRELVGHVPSKRVPFILKLANERTGSEYPHPFSATLSRDLVVELVTGRIVDPAGVADWLDRRRAASPQQVWR